MTQPFGRRSLPVAARTAAVIVTHNGARWIAACLASLRGEVLDLVIIVDNASRDETLALAAEACPAAVLIQLDSNRGFGMANNYGIQRALDLGAEYVCLVNQDLTIEPGCISRMVSALCQEHRVGMTAALQLSYDGAALNPGFLEFVPARLWSDLVLSEARESYDVEVIPAAAIVISRIALQEAGGFDPLFFMYFEDFDLCSRLRSREFRILMVPDARVRHWDGAVNARRSLAWHCTWEYSRLVLHLKRSRRSFFPALVSGMKYAGFPRSWKQAAARLAAICRCLGRARRIALHTAGIPFEFAARSETSARDFRKGSALNGENEGIPEKARDGSPCAT